MYNFNVGTCIQCGNKTARPTYKYCSNKCQNDFQYELYVDHWKKGDVSGGRGINAKSISRHLRRYLLKKSNFSCSICRWNKVNISTGEVPLEVDHIDGDADNNSEENLRVICPNCHALTPNFRNLNKGKGRAWRRIKYLKSDTVKPA